MNGLSALLSDANSWNYRYFICTDSQRAQTNQFFAQILPVTQTTVLLNVQCNFCLVICNTELM